MDAAKGKYEGDTMQWDAWVSKWKIQYLRRVVHLGVHRL